MRARDDQLRTLRVLVDLHQIHLDALPGPVALGGHLLAGGHHRFGLVQLDDHRTRVRSLDDAIHHLALPVGVLLVDGVPLVVANLLKNDLLGGLRGDTAEVLRSLFDPDLIADHRGVFVCAGFWERNFGFGVGNFRHHPACAPDVHLAGSGVDCDVDFFLSARHFLVDRLERVLDRSQHGLAGDASFRGYLRDCGVQITFHPENLLARVAQ